MERTVIIKALGVCTGKWYEAERISGLTMDEALEHVRRAYIDYDADSVTVTIL
jgi:hypothetical protein